MAEELREAIEIDESARKKVEDALKQKDEINDTIRKRKSAIYEELMSKVESETAAYKEELDALVNEKQANIDGEIEAALEKLEKDYKLVKDRLVKTIVENVKNG